VLNGRILPGRLEIGVGVYVSWGSEQLATEPEYLVVQPNCSCSFFSPALAADHSGLVLTPDQLNFFAHGRVQFTDGKIALSRVNTVPTSTMLYAEWYINDAGTEVFKPQAAEVLVCESSSPPAAAPVLAFANDACGVWKSASNVNPTSIRSLGFNAGTSLNNTIAWVARGLNNGALQVGRFQTETGTTYVANEQLASVSEFLVVPDGCSCQFVDPNEAWMSAGLVTAPGHYGFGRVNFTNGQMVISRVNMSVDTNFTQWYPNSLNSSALISDGNTKEVLVCKTNPPPTTLLLHPCDLWVKYFKDASPTINGFSAGESANAIAYTMPAYIARGFHNSWLIPGRVQVNFTGRIYVTDGSEYVTNPSFGAVANPNALPMPSDGSGEYLVVRDGCECKWFAPSVAVTRKGLVRTAERFPAPSSPFDYLISRIKYAWPVTRVSIGKTTFTPTSSFNTWWTEYTSNSGNFMPSANEVLVCDSTQDMGTRPTLNFGNEACGLWSRYRPSTVLFSPSQPWSNWPATHGFPLSSNGLNMVDQNGNPIYVGRGNYNDVIWIGRVQTAFTPNSRGVYVPGSFTTGMPQRKAILPEYLVWPNNCNCYWHPTYATAVTKIGLVRSIDDRYGFAIALIDFGSYQALASVNTITNEMWYINNGVVNYATTTSTTKLLVCET
jgi:hypothetical protein